MALQDYTPDITTLINQLQANNQTAAGQLGHISTSINAPSPGAVAANPALSSGTSMPDLGPASQAATPSPATPSPATSSPVESYLNSIGAAFNSGSSGTGLGNAVGAALNPVTTTASDAINAVGSAVHGVASPLLENPFIQQLLKAANTASATAPIGQSLNQAEQLLGGTTGANVPTVYGQPTNTVQGANGAGTTGGLSTAYDGQIAQLTQKSQMLTNYLQGLPSNSPQYAQYQKALDDTNTQLKNLYGLQADSRTNAGAIGQYASGSDGAKDIVSTGQENERLVELKQNLAKDLSVAKPDPVQIVADVQAIRNDSSLLEGFKRMPGGDAAESALTSMDSSLDGLLDPISGLVNPAKLKGVLSAINNTSQIIGNNYDTMMRQGQIYDSTKGVGNLETAQRYNKYYQTPVAMSADSAVQNAIQNLDTSEKSPLNQTAIGQAEAAGYLGGRGQAAQLKGKTEGYTNAILDPNGNNIQLPKGLSQQQYETLKYQAGNGDTKSIKYLKSQGLPLK